jgi:hypothetical protein
VSRSDRRTFEYESKFRLSECLPVFKRLVPSLLGPCKVEPRLSSYYKERPLRALVRFLNQCAGALSIAMTCVFFVGVIFGVTGGPAREWRFRAVEICFAEVQPLTPTQLDTVVGPIALYADPLLAQVLTASTVPNQITQAGQWVQLHPDLSGLAQQPWDPSVTFVARYPTVIKKMYGDFAWTSRLGSAFTYQESDVLAAVQRLRRKAQILGNLASNSQHSVVVEGSTIQILPAQTSIIYVPQYDPTVVYTTKPSTPGVALLAFAAGVAIGSASNNNTTHVVYAYPTSVNWNTGVVVHHTAPPSGWAHAYYGTGPVGYGTGYTAHGTGPAGNDWRAGTVQGRTWNGGAYQGSAVSREWENGATTGSYRGSAVGPNGAVTASGKKYENDDLKAGTFSRTGTTANGAYRVSGSGFKSDDGQAGSVTASGVNRQGDYRSKTWTNSGGDWSSSSRSGNVFSQSHSGSAATQFSNRGYASRSSGFHGGGGVRRR